MKKIFSNNKYLIIIGFLSVIYIIFYSYVFFLESDGCTLKDVPELITNPTQLSKNYCGDVEALTFLPIELNGIVSILMNTLLWISFATALLFPIGVLKVVIGFFAKKPR